MMRLGNQIRSKLMAAIYGKCLSLSNESVASVGTGRIVSLMSVDSESLRTFIPQVHNLWAAPLFIIGSIVLLYEELEWCAFLGFLAIVFVAPFSGMVFKKLYAFRKMIAPLQDKRTGIMNEVINGIRVLKYYTWERAYRAAVTVIREQELDLIWRQSWINAWFGVILFAAPTLISVTAIGAYSLVAGNTLTTTRAYTSLALFNILRIPLAMLPMTIQSFSAAKVSFRRLASFFDEDESGRAPAPEAPRPGARDTGGEEEEEEEEGGGAIGTPPSSRCARGEMLLDACTFVWRMTVTPEDDKGKDADQGERDARPVPGDAGDADAGDAENGDAGEPAARGPAGKYAASAGDAAGKGKHPPERKPAAEPVVVEWRLEDVSLEVGAGSLTMIVGDVGTGKSSMISALSGSMRHEAGRRLVGGAGGDGGDPKIAVVTQVPWILNDTLRNNVLFGLEYDGPRYEEAIRAAQLLPDLEILNGGDMTEIGERGVTLSGGQKQRVSIARCIYADADIVLLDDPLSAVDAHVGARLFEEVISSETGCLRGKTRVLVTNALPYLPKADHIVVMRKLMRAAAEGDDGAGELMSSYGGAISEQGSFEGLVSSGLEFSELMRTHNVRDTDEDDRRSQDGDGSSEGSDVDVSVTKASGGAAASREELGRITGEETREVGAVSGKVYWEYAKAMGGETTAGGILAVSLVLLSFSIDYGTRAFMDYWLTFWTEDRFHLDRDHESKHYYLQIYILLFLVSSVFTYYRSVVLYSFTVRAARNLHEELMARVIRLPMSFFDTTPSGRVINRFGKDTQSNDTEIGGVLIQALGCFFNIITTFVLISIASPWFVVAIPEILIVYAFIQRFYIPGSRELQRIQSVSLSPIYSNFSETLNGIPVIRAYRTSRYFTRKNDRFVYDNARAYLTQTLVAMWLSLQLDVLGAVVLLLTAVFVVHGDVDPGLAGLALVYALDVTKFMKFGTQMASQMEIKMNSVERVVQYYDLDVEADEDTPPGSRAIVAAELASFARGAEGGGAGARPDARGPEDYESLIASWPSRGEIVLRDVCMRYRPELPVVLKSLSLRIGAGERIGVVGRTGSGKSSILQALMRTVEIESGSITIDGVDISRLGLKDLRRKIGIIPQDPILFSGTLRRNVDPFGHFEDHELVRAIRDAGLTGVLLDDEVSDSGSNLSVGQRQLVCLARALVSRCRILLLDEATASVDYETDAKIQRAIVANFIEAGDRRSTVISIAHRLNTVLDHDRVLVMEDGAAVEFDDPHRLLHEFAHDRDEVGSPRAAGALADMVNSTGQQNAKLLRAISKRSFEDRRDRKKIQ